MTISQEKRESVFRMHANGIKNMDIAKSLKLPESTVSTLLKQFQSRGDIQAYTSPGRPPKLSDRAKRYAVRMVTKEEGGSAVRAAHELNKTEGANISPEGIRRVLRARGLHGRVKPLKPNLSQQQRIQRLKFAKDHIGKPASYWRSVLFTDESPFFLFPAKRGQWTWRKPGDKFLPRNVVPTKKHGGGSLMVWGCLSYRGIGWSCSLPEGLDGPTYLSILKGELKATANYYYGGLNKVIFQQDGAGPHRYSKAMEYITKQTKEVLKWPAQSPDLNPLENLWADIKRRIEENHGLIYTKEQLWEIVDDEIEATPLETCQKLVDSIPKRLDAVIKAHGGPTKY